MKNVNTINLLAFLLFSLQLKAQEIFNPDNYSFECTGKVVLPTLYETLYVYDGNDPKIETEEKVILVKGEPKWEKKKADRNCLSANPDDCLVWCLVEQLEEKVYLLIKDTSSSNEWHTKKIEIRPKGQKKEMPVVCKSELSETLISALRDKLYALNYDIKPNKKYKKLRGKLNKEFKQFQYDYDLPVGKWTVETMQFLYNLN